MDLLAGMVFPLLLRRFVAGIGLLNSNAGISVKGKVFGRRQERVNVTINDVQTNIL